MKANKKVFAIDANVILRYVLRDNESQSAKAKDVFDAVGDGRLTVFCDPVTLAEVVWVLGSHYKSPPGDTIAALEPIVSNSGFIMPEKEIYLCALRLYATSVPHFGDACACAAAVEKCEGRLLSFDRKLSKIRGVTRLESP